MRPFLILLLAASLCLASEVRDGVVPELLSRTQLEAEIAAFMPGERKLFVVGGEALSVLDLGEPKKPRVVQTLEFKGEAASVSVSGNMVAVAFPGVRTGRLKLYRFENGKLSETHDLEVCAGLDMVTFTPDAKYLVGACEGSPNDDYSFDPEGAVLLVSFPGAAPKIQELKFNHLDSAALLKAGVRRSAPATSNFFQTLEPEYVTVSADSKTAWVSLQENNAIAMVDLTVPKVQSVFPLGALDHALPENSLAVRKGKNVKLENVPLLGLRQPDGIAVLEKDGIPLVFTANEGASLDGEFFNDEDNVLSRFEKGDLDINAFSPHLQTLKDKEVAKDDCPAKTQGKCTSLYSFGSRSVSAFNGKTGELVWDSGNLIEAKLAQVAPQYFNWNSKKLKIKVNARSDSKGPEPENLTLGQVGGKTYAFVGLERMSGIFTFDISGAKPEYVGYGMDTADRGPEGVLFIPAEESPTKEPLLVVCYEYSQTLAIYSLVNFLKH